jgi:hypothetical protein
MVWKWQAVSTANKLFPTFWRPALAKPKTISTRRSGFQMPGSSYVTRVEASLSTPFDLTALSSTAGIRAGFDISSLLMCIDRHFGCIWFSRDSDRLLYWVSQMEPDLVAPKYYDDWTGQNLLRPIAF